MTRPAFTLTIFRWGRRCSIRSMGKKRTFLRTAYLQNITALMLSRSGPMALPKMAGCLIASVGTYSARRNRLTLNTTGNPVLDVIGIVLLMGLLALPAAIGVVIWYAIKVWFTTKIVKKAWVDKKRQKGQV